MFHLFPKYTQDFFAAHGAAARHAIAKTTRSLLLKGGDGVHSYDVPTYMTLQDFALHYLLKDDNVSKVMVGCSDQRHVVEAFDAAEKVNCR